MNTDEIRELRSLRQEYIDSRLRRRINAVEGDASIEQINEWEAALIRYWKNDYPALSAALADVSFAASGSGEAGTE